MHYFNVTEVDKHPDYNGLFYGNQSIFPSIYIRYDIALFKMERPINQTPVHNSQGIPIVLRSICLPERNVFNKRRELVLFSGWGLINRTAHGLKVGYKTIYPSDDYSSENSVRYIYYTSPDNSSRTCQVKIRRKLEENHELVVQ